MKSHIDFFGPGANLEGRYVANHEELQERIAHLRKAFPGAKVVLTMGSFDMVHVGHARYLEKGRELGDLLVVGVETDAKVQKRKGPNRPVVPEDERREMLAHIRHVDIITDKRETDPKWHLIKLVQPDVLLATKDTYKPEELEALKEFCKEVVVLEAQATTSTSAKLRRLNAGIADKIKQSMQQLIEDTVEKASSKG